MNITRHKYLYIYRITMAHPIDVDDIYCTILKKGLSIEKEDENISCFCTKIQSDHFQYHSRNNVNTDNIPKGKNSNSYTMP